MEFLFGSVVLLFALLGVAGLVLTIWALVDVVRMPSDDAFRSGTQLVWVLVIVLVQGIGAIIYLAVGRPPGGASAARERASRGPESPPPPVRTDG